MPLFYILLNTNKVLQANTTLYYLSSMLHARWSFVEPKHVAWCQIVVSVCNITFVFKTRIIFPIYFWLHVIIPYWMIVALIKGATLLNSVGPIDDGRRKEPKNPDFNIQTANILHFIRRLISYGTEGTVWFHLKGYPISSM